MYSDSSSKLTVANESNCILSTCSNLCHDILVRHRNCSDEVVLTCTGGGMMDMIRSRVKCCMSLSCSCDMLTVFSDNPALWYGQSDLKHRVKTFTIESICDFKSVNAEGVLLPRKEDCDFHSLSILDSSLPALDGNKLSVDTVGK